MQNRHTSCMAIFLTVTILVITVLCGEWRASFTAEADITGKKYLIKVMVFGVSILRLDISPDGFAPALGYVWLRVNGKRRGISLTTDESDKDSIIRYLRNPLTDALDVHRMSLGVRIGAAGYDAESALLVQLVRMAAAAGVTVLKGMQRVDFSGRIRADFGKNTLRIYAKGIMGACPANIIYGFAAAAVRKAAAKMRGERIRAKGDRT